MYRSPALKLGGRLLTCMAVHKSAEAESLVSDLAMRSEKVNVRPLVTSAATFRRIALICGNTDIGLLAS